MHFPGVGVGGVWGAKVGDEVRRGREEKKRTVIEIRSRLVRARMPRGRGLIGRETLVVARNRVGE